MSGRGSTSPSRDWRGRRYDRRRASRVCRERSEYRVARLRVRVRASALPGAIPRDLLEQLRNAAIPDPDAVTGFGAFNPVFNLPAGFVQRLGLKASDQFLSGTFPSGARTFGFLRIASYSPSSSAAALAQFRTEMAYFQQNVDGLIIDQMRNPGGSVCYAQNIVASLMPGEFRAIGFEVRATRNVLLNAYSALNSALLFGQQTNAEQYQLIYDNVLAAYQANRANTSAMPLCGSTLTTQPAMDSTGAVMPGTSTNARPYPDCHAREGGHPVMMVWRIGIGARR